MKNPHSVSDTIIHELRKAVVGKDDILLKIFLAALARGHVLLEDIPGVGKTTIALAFSRALDLRYQRVQFTPDVMPSDLTGFSLYDRETGKMQYQPGALLCNLFLADELNRATSRVQSALLEAMEEGQVTVDGVSRPVPQPFLVIATQNPTGAAGTQLLPDSQRDRFALRLSIGYPTLEQEAHMVRRKEKGNPLEQVNRVISHGQLEELRQSVDQVYVSDDVLDYLLRLIDATRNDSRILLGASPRGTLALSAVSRALAFVRGRDYVLPEDVSGVFRDVIAHRLLYPSGKEYGPGPDPLEDILRRVKPPEIR